MTHGSSDAPADGPSLLLVEDDDGDAYLVQEVLRDSGIRAQVRRAVDLRQARSMVESEAPDVVLLDLGLPDSSGLAVVEEVVRASPSSAVLVLTGLDDEHRGIAAVAAGAQDYLVKGTVDGHLLARAIRYALERKRVDESLRRLVETELRAAENSRLERGLIPQPRVNDPNLRTYTHYRPGRHQALLGGDFYDIVERADHRLFVVVGDVSGHGPDEAALGVMLRVAWRTLVLAGTEGVAILPGLSVLLEAERQHDEVFATVVQLEVSPDRRSGKVWLAGHPSPVALGDPCRRLALEETGPPIGLGFGRWRTSTVDLAESFPLMLYTDGLIDAGHGGDRLSEEGLLQLLDEELPGTDLAKLPGRLVDRAEELQGGALSDDVAMVILDVAGRGQ